jgi:hypothetical protein
MRRNIVCALLFALALAVQALAPAAARAAMGFSQQTCVTASVDGSAGKGQPSGHPDAHSASCDLCALCCGSLALGARASAILPASLAWTTATWPIVENAASSARRDAVRARAPPTFS